MKPKYILLFVLLAIGGLDAGYLTYEHYTQLIPPCSTSIFVDCGKVLQSKYSTIMGFPLSLLGLLHYINLLFWVTLTFYYSRPIFKRIVFLFSAIGFLFSLYLVWLQLFVIGAICLYCMLSAFTSIALYVSLRYVFWQDYHELLLKKIEVVYKFFAKPILFFIDPEFIHNNAMVFGEMFGKIPLVRWMLKKIFGYKNLRLRQKIEGLSFANPVGLSAGYDYEAAFPRILPSIGFGFQTIGTISHMPCEGNAKPRLGRLPKSKSLLVNKGFKNPGALHIAKKMAKVSFEFPVGISIGTTNSTSIKTQKDAIEDILSAFKIFEESNVRHSYYELNISCPNLKVTVSFYEPEKLKELLTAVHKLKIKKPLFIKMPIDKTDAEVKKMLDVIVSFSYVTGVIFGNLQKNRKDSAFDTDEIKAAGKGNFSGKPTEKRSNELISVAYKHAGKKLVIIGCGGIFTAEDAYTKIRLGASLLQLITGMIFEGPQLITQINRGLASFLKRDGFTHLSDAVGVDIK